MNFAPFALAPSPRATLIVEALDGKTKMKDRRVGCVSRALNTMANR